MCIRDSLWTTWDFLCCNVSLSEEPVRYGVFHKPSIPINVHGNVKFIHADVRTAMCCHRDPVHTLPEHHLYIYHREVAISACGKVLIPPGTPNHLFIPLSKLWNCTCCLAKFPTSHPTPDCIHVITIPQSRNMRLSDVLLTLFQCPKSILVSRQRIPPRQCILVTFKDHNV